jgi:hypothetical protein
MQHVRDRPEAIDSHPNRTSKKKKALAGIPL